MSHNITEMRTKRKKLKKFLFFVLLVKFLRISFLCSVFSVRYFETLFTLSYIESMHKIKLEIMLSKSFLNIINNNTLNSIFRKMKKFLKTLYCSKVMLL